MTPEQEEQVRRALGAVARHEPVTPMPPDVAARLDAVLAGLADSGLTDSGPGSAPGDLGADVPSRQRHRRWSVVLVAAAAAAVVVLAGGVVGLRELTGSGAPQHEAGATASGGASASRSATTPQGPAAFGVRGPAGRTRGVPLLSTATLARDVQRVVDGGLAAPARRPAPSPVASRTLGSSAGPSRAFPGSGSGPVTLAPSAGRFPARCAAPPVGPGVQLLAVRLDRRPAWLAVPVRAGTEVARVYACDSTGTPVATATVHVP